ncbi:MAG: hypothetical protein ACRD01_05025 [Terriglobales bacterium]
MTVCPHCQATALRRTRRTTRERLLGRAAAAYRCEQCASRHVEMVVKHCWRCGTDLDRRRRETATDYVAAGLALWPYSCRRCGTRRYRWGRN